MPLPVTFATLAAGNQPLSLFDTSNNAIAALGAIPCAASGTNALVLTPNTNTPTVSSYPDLQPSFVFVAPATSTGSVSINVAGVGSRNAYKWNAATQFGTNTVGAGDIQSGGVYRATPLTALNAGAGGFVLDAIGLNNTNLVDIEFVIDGGGSPITAGVKGFLRTPFSASISTVTLAADQSGSITIDLFRANNAIPTVSIIGGGNKPALSSAQFGTTTPAAWTSTLLAQNDWIGFDVTALATNITRVTVDMTCFKL